MFETYGKYFRLLMLILLSFAGFIGLAFLLLYLFKWFFRLLDTARVTYDVFLFLLMLVPAAIFISIHTAYYKRTKSYGVKGIRYFSNLLFFLGIFSWLFALCIDIHTYFTTGNADTSKYLSFDKWLLIPNGTAIFLVGIIQALFSPQTT